MAPPPPAAGAASASAAASAAADAAKDKKKAADKGKKQPPRVVNTLICPPEKHISVEMGELKAALKARLDLGDRLAFDTISNLMEGIANFDFFDLKRRMKNNFLPFATGARHSTYLQRQGRTLPTTPALDEKEARFIADVYEVLRASHYTLLNKDEWDIATSEDFSVSHPVAINWAYMDSTMLERFWAADVERLTIRNDMPEEMADRILVFHRGVGVAKQSGLLIPQKLDLLVEYTVLWLVDKLTGGLARKIRGGDHEAAAKKVAKEAAAKAKKAGGLTPSTSSGALSASPTGKTVGMDAAAKSAVAAVDAEAAAAAASSSSSSTAVAPSPSKVTVSQRPVSAKRAVRKLTHSSTERGRVEGDRYMMSTHKYAKVVERNTLKRQCPNLLTLLKAFPRSMELQEPTFKDVVVLYRRAYPERKPPRASAHLPAKSREERMKGILNYRNIYVKVFGETPMADMEVILPEKVVGIKALTLVNLAVTIATALSTGALMLWRAGSSIDMNLCWTSASLVLTRCFQVYSQAQAEKAAAQQLMAAQLYDKMQDSQEGVVTAIMDEMADQQLKQMLMAYVILLIKQRPVTLDELDEACEEMLARDFDHRIDFQIQDALPRLEAWGLVSRVGAGGAALAARPGAPLETTGGGVVKLEAMPMETAVAVLSTAWASAYEALGAAGGGGGSSSGGGAGGASVEDVPTVDLITGAASSFATRISAAREELRLRDAEEQALASQSKFQKAFGKKQLPPHAAETRGGAVGGVPTLAASPTPGAAGPVAGAPAGALAPTPTPDGEHHAKKKGFGKFMDKLLN